MSRGVESQLGRRVTTADLERGDHDPHPEDREGPKEGYQLPSISLTSCVVVKTMERIVNERLRWYLETGNILAPDQATYLSQELKMLSGSRSSSLQPG